LLRYRSQVGAAKGKHYPPLFFDQVPAVIYKHAGLIRHFIPVARRPYNHTGKTTACHSERMRGIFRISRRARNDRTDLKAKGHRRAAEPEKRLFEAGKIL